MDVFFFFQAEDGIRDGRVTGVQTCALPISPASATVSACFWTRRPISCSMSTEFPCTTRSTGHARSAIVPTCSTPRALLTRRRSTSTPSCAMPGCSVDATSSMTAIPRASVRSPMMNPPSDQIAIAMKVSSYLLFALLIPAAQAQQPAPDVLVKSISEEVVAILKKDKDIQAGDSKKVVELIETKVVPHFDFIRMTRVAD